MLRRSSPIPVPDPLSGGIPGLGAVRRLRFRVACRRCGPFGYTRTPKAVYCVKHDHRPTETTKMDGAVQTVYPRKNWSSLMLFNCVHPAVRRLTPDIVNRTSGAYLHRMQWVADEEIGALPCDWNWLEGSDRKPAQGTPKAVHFTRGGPWFQNWRNVDYGDLWRTERDAMLVLA